MSKITEKFDEACLRFGGRTAFYFLHHGKLRKKSFTELSEDVKKVLEHLIRRGVSEGERVLVFVTPSYELLVFMLACMKAGASVMFVDIWAGKKLIKRTLQEYNADHIAVSGKTRFLRLAFGDIAKIKRLLFIEKMFREDGNEGEGKNREVTEEMTAVLTMTTGSTGRPKIVARSHEDLFNQLTLINDNMEERDEGIVTLTTSFMYHFAGIIKGFTGVLTDLKPGLTPPFFMNKKLRKFKSLPIDTILTTPDFCMAAENVFPRLQRLYVGGAVLNHYEATKIRETFSGVKITYIYGATECNLIAVTDLDDYIRELETSGQTVLGEAVKGVEIRHDEHFEIMVHGKAVLKKYLFGENKKGEVDPDGRYRHRTGDAGRMTGGKLYYLGRRDVYVKGKKEMLFSNALEQEIVLTFPGTEKCAFFYHEGRNFLFLQGKTEADEEAVRRFLSEKGIEEETVIRLRYRIPCDAKHHTKINYNKLKRIADRM